MHYICMLESLSVGYSIFTSFTQLELHNKQRQLSQREKELHSLKDKHQSMDEHISQQLILRTKYSEQAIKPVKETTLRMLRSVQSVR